MSTITVFSVRMYRRFVIGMALTILISSFMSAISLAQPSLSAQLV